MANSGAVWGIDIGQCALKALRCRPHEKDTDRVVVEAFDYIEYPKILSQPDADREELIREALETFLSRNELKGDRVVMSVPGQNGLARFVKLPPVEAKKIPDIVKYEARTQIPFALEDVVWDYQPLAGGSQDEGFALEMEVGLFAMKRDQVARALEPLESAGIEVDCIQLAPLAVYNYATFDRLNNLEGAPDYDPENPTPSIVILSFGADATDLVVTNGYRVWQRNIPIGGSHFTKALTKEMRITFAKAEHLKRNATKAEDPKAVFQAMRPVFSDLIAEIQRSLGFFSSNNRGAEISEVIALGNPMKLPGLERYLSQNLEQPVKPIAEYDRLIGGSVTDSSQFKDNYLGFAVAYGLCLQGLGLSQLKTNLLPEDIVTKRLVRAKKPWAVAAAALLMVGLAANYVSHVASLQTVDIENDWKSPISSAQGFAQQASGYAGDNSTLQEKFTQIKTIGENLQSNADGRLLWLELLKGIDSALPKDERPIGEREKTVADVTSREELHIESMDCQFYPDVSVWFSGPVKKSYEDALTSKELWEAAKKLNLPEVEGTDQAKAPPGEGDAAASPDGETDPDEATEDATEEPAADAQFADDGFGGESDGDGTGATGPTGEGWVIQLVGHHFHNSPSGEANKDNGVKRTDESDMFVRRTLIRNLLEGSVQLPDGPGGELKEVTLADLGISYPVLVTKAPIETYTYDPNATSDEQAGRPRASAGFGNELGGGFGGPSGFVGQRPGALLDPDAELEPELWKIRRYNFIIQFLWQPRPRHVRENPSPEGDEAGFGETASQSGSGGQRVAIRWQ